MYWVLDPRREYLSIICRKETLQYFSILSNKTVEVWWQCMVCGPHVLSDTVLTDRPWPPLLRGFRWYREKRSRDWEMGALEYKLQVHIERGLLTWLYCSFWSATEVCWYVSTFPNQSNGLEASGLFSHQLQSNCWPSVVSSMIAGSRRGYENKVVFIAQDRVRGYKYRKCLNNIIYKPRSMQAYLKGAEAKYQAMEVDKD